MKNFFQTPLGIGVERLLKTIGAVIVAYLIVHPFTNASQFSSTALLAFGSGLLMAIEKTILQMYAYPFITSTLSKGTTSIPTPAPTV